MGYVILGLLIFYLILILIGGIIITSEWYKICKEKKKHEDISKWDKSH